MRLRDLTPLDVPSMLALNNAAAPAVPASSEVELTELLRVSSFGFAAVSGEEFLGFVVGFEPGIDYASPNYHYFENRGTDHLYVDRIVVAEAARGMRVGQTLYNRVVDLAIDQGRAEVTCEVNIEPPNPASLAFHSRLGFSEVDRQENGYATVTLLVRPLS